MKIKQIVISLLTACVLFSCESTEIESNENKTLANQESPVIRKLLDKGYKIENIQEIKDFYLVEGDLKFSKNIEDYNNKTGRHASTNNLVSQQYRVITVYIDNTVSQSGTDDWSSAISSAMSKWSDLPNTSVKFVRVFENADITIKSDYGLLPNNVIASAGFPNANGKAYSNVDVNLDFNSNQNISENTKIYNMVHELGHCIGFRHTNWENEGYYDQNGFLIGANLIPNTPSQDANSVMNSGTALYSWNGFSTYDVTAVNYLYPTLPCSSRLNGPFEGICAFDRYNDPIRYNVYTVGTKQNTVDNGTNTTWQVSGNSLEIVYTNSSACEVRVKANNTIWPATGIVTKTSGTGCTTTYNVSMNNCINYSYSD